MNNNDITHKKGKVQPGDTIRNYKLNNEEDEYQNEDENKEQDLLSDEDQENQDIADIHQWKEQYNQLRHELFDHNQINILKLLALNKTTKLKHKIVIMSSEEDENNYDRSRERELIFKKIKALRVELRIYKENKRSKKMKPDQLQEQITAIEQKFDDLKLEQMNIFNTMEKERAQIEDYVKKIDSKISETYDYDDDQNESDEDLQNTKNSKNYKYSNGFDNVDNEDDEEDHTIPKGKKKDTLKLTKMQKQNSQINLYEVNEVAEEYQDGNESLLTKNDGVQSFAKSQTTRNKLESNNTYLLLDTDEEEEEEYREILEQVGVKYGVEDEELEEQEEIEQKIQSQLKKTDNKHNKVTLVRKNSSSNSNKENIGMDGNNKNTTNKNKHSISDKNSKLLMENKNNDQSDDDNDDENQQQEDQEENDYDPDEDIMRDELNFQLQQNKKQKKEREEDRTEQNNLQNQIEDMENDLTDLKVNIDRISNQMKGLGDRNLGWLKEDHQDFLRVRSKYKNDVKSLKFLDECVNVIPVHTREEIEEHAQLYVKYSELDLEKKDTLKRYKDIKDEKTKLEEELKLNKMRVQDELLIKRKLKKTKEEIMEERLKQKDRIMIWKQNKLSYKDSIVQQEIEEKKILFTLDKEKKSRDDKLREERKLLIKQYQEQKEQERLKLKQMEEQQKEKDKMKKKVSLSEIVRIKEKEEFMVRKKQIRVLEKKIQTKEESDNIQRIQLLNKEKFSYVETRLQDQTKAAERRITQKYDNQGKIDRFGPSAESFAGNPLGIGGRLKVPSWRSSNV